MGKELHTLRLDSPAKVNLRLEILMRREDGYHEIRTIFQKISLHDTLHFSLRPDKGIRIITTQPGLPTGRKNLVYRAVKSLLERADYRGGVEVVIEKRIPLGGGLGGGSSNAATALKALNHLLKLKLGQKELMEEGRKIGADVAFFLFKGAAIGTGIGERLRKIALPTLWYLLIYPNFEVSTRWAYQNVLLTRRAEENSPFEKKLRNHSSEAIPRKEHPFSWGGEGLTKTKYHINLRKLLKSSRGISGLLYNDLEGVVSTRYPEITLMKEMLLSAGATGALMSGSGPTVFGLFSGEKKAKEGYWQLERKVRARGWKIFQAHSLP